LSFLAKGAITVPKRNNRQKNGNAGRPSEWRNSPTQTIRVPKSLVPKILEIAHELDAGLQEPMIIQPEDLKVQRQEKHASLALQNVISHSNKEGLMRKPPEPQDYPGKRAGGEHPDEAMSSKRWSTAF